MKCIACNGIVKKNNTSFGECVDCGKKYTFVETYSRIVGYVRPIEQWNPGKQEEFKDRKLFNISEKQTFI
jgi:anaerobic ribonucleoside-triphosphate reductase